MIALNSVAAKIKKDDAMRYLRNYLFEYIKWSRRGYASPSPHFIKQACILENGIKCAIWIETGTYLGETTRLLSKVASKVYSIEPEPKLFCKAKCYFNSVANVEILNGTSEDVFPDILPSIKGDVCFWLDGHFSGDGTYKGINDTPILKELDYIAEHLHRMNNVVVMVDDVRLFTGGVHSYGNYPTLDYLVDWARALELVWHIEHDIFIAKKNNARNK